MKKILVALFAVAFISPMAFAEFGLGLRLGALQNDDAMIDYVKDNFTSYSTTESYGMFGIEGFYEKAGLFNLDERHAFGIRLGFDIIGADKVKFPRSPKVTANTFKVPLTVYYKYTPAESKFAFWGGLGASYAFTEWEEDSETLDDSIIMPHIKAGVEYRFTKLFALGVDLGYNFNGEMQEGPAFLERDITGFEGALAARFYF